MRMSGRMSGRNELMCDLCTTVGLRQLVILGLAQVCASWIGFAQAGFAQAGFAQAGFAQTGFAQG